jgi:hypothetical protein
VLFLSYSILLTSPSTAKPQITMAQTLEQRKRNAKFAKTQEARMGKSEEQLQKKVKTVHKSPISMFWMGKMTLPFPLSFVTCAASPRLLRR